MLLAYANAHDARNTVNRIKHAGGSLETCSKKCGQEPKRRQVPLGFPHISQPEEEAQHYTNQSDTHTCNLIPSMYRGCVALFRGRGGLGTACP